MLKDGLKGPHLFTLSDHHPSLVLRVPRGSMSVAFIECSARKKNATLTLEIALDPRSALTVVFVWRGKAGATIAQKIRVAQGARLHLVNLTLGSCTQETISEVIGAQGESRIDWIIHGQKKMECRLSARNVFLGREGRGDLEIRGVVEGHAKASCNGSVEIGPKASGTQAHLTEKILLLDPTARADAIPSLDVETHDVQASHSASVSRIHPEDLFYFASRGITQKQARKLFIDGFLGSLLDHIPGDGLKEMSRAALHT
ncbi:MAG: Fe-S cluster assembly protein SufD [Candidatus Peribacter riflensis]|uniref:Fe-S cluster assembly protein SufD n=1 Tax=Candidatus Peribacter riflensis TaxID=1735162 RepID=A0A0S1SJ22_9BACT|nr:MAG: Fe-S cluster assembly protein SufD [Candidatus Peribacter riflensis]OGJ78474.1 MAG: hypothetical protein A2398_02420 [Candidatus Peribacteria bacterium RIFOXYB1_FULL_57_12]OGJ80400.1 MAG: hypothetical protein A2412_00680 [Candidatus Peribacteria bacterium RIFOXYC1_FULL_58_8]ALM11437.1 MAG: Fe-S cluster assembly protein SufD [Candidatus Peribacter riflensis]ALM12539.1 MAG: Fe-S cluster assembly protein SufD [Candidatus Peribacter riflensis]